MEAAAQSIDLDLQSAPQARGNAMLEDLDALRRTEPVFWSDLSQCWILTRHADVADMFMDRLPVRHAGRIEASAFGALPAEARARIPTLLTSVPKWIINLDGTPHARLRKLLMKAFSRRLIDSFQAYARGEADRLIDQWIDAPAFEFNEGFARPMTGHVLFKMLGMPESLFPQLKDWAIAVVEGLGNVGSSIDKLERADWAARKMNEAVLIELGERRRVPHDDLLTSLLNVTEAGDTLTVEELLGQLQVIIVAGHDTTANTMTLALEALSRNPRALTYMREQPEQMAACVAEIQRYTAMSAGQALIASEDFDLHGKRIKAGQVVVGMIAAADRDPLEFEDPGSLDLSRDNRRSLVFAPGPHFCLGHLLAKMQLREFFAALAARVEGIDLIDDKLRFMPVFSFRGLYELNVRLRPR